MEMAPATQILERYAGDESAVIRALQDIQEEYNYLPREALEMTATQLGVPLTHVLRAATFYKQFSLEPRGKHCITVCTGTACHVRGAPRIVETLQRELDVEIGGTTKDLQFSLEVARCIGCCSMAPAVRIDDEVRGRARPDQMMRLLRRYREQGE
jgi:NADH:ubiquinone oxidoreductase subunit E